MGGTRETRMQKRLKQATIEAESEEAEDEVADDPGSDENEDEEALNEEAEVSDAPFYYYIVVLEVRIRCQWGPPRHPYGKLSFNDHGITESKYVYQMSSRGRCEGGEGLWAYQKAAACQKSCRGGLPESGGPSEGWWQPRERLSSASPPTCT